MRNSHTDTCYCWPGTLSPIFSDKTLWNARTPPSRSVQEAGVGAPCPPPLLEPGRDVRRPVLSEHLLSPGWAQPEMEKERLHYLSLDPTGPESSPPGASGYVSPSQPELGFLILTIGRVPALTQSCRIQLFHSISRKSSRWFTSQSRW